MKKSRMLGAVCACLSAISFNTSAALIDNGNTTIDTSMELEWLDLTLTQGKSYNNIVIDGYGGYAAQGYAHATIDQLCGLFGSYGDDMTGCTSAVDAPIPLAQASADNLVDLLGTTTLPSQINRAGAYGIFQGPTQGVVGLACIDAMHDTGCRDPGPKAFATDGWGEQTISYPDLGNFLVRSAVVPIPPALWLFGTGLLGLIGIARRKKVA